MIEIALIGVMSPRKASEYIIIFISIYKYKLQYLNLIDKGRIEIGNYHFLL